MNYQVNWITGASGNGIKSGSTLTIKIDGVQYLSGGIYKDNFPVLAFFEMGSTVSIPLVKGRTFFRRPKPLPKGEYVLKVRAATQGWDDPFQIY